MIRIESNGSRWNGEPPAAIDELLAVMASTPLCPSFVDLADQPGDRPFEGAARVARQNPDWTPHSPRNVSRWLDGDPIYPESPDARRFFGNFAEVSHVFCIDTDEPELLERLRTAIADNMATPAFQAVSARRAA